MFTVKKSVALVVGLVALLGIIPFVAKAVRTDVSRDFPVYNNHGKPDLTVDPKRFVSQMEIIDRLFDASSCEIAEGSVGGTGYRRLLRFDTVLINGGDGLQASGRRSDLHKREYQVGGHWPGQTPFSHASRSKSVLLYRVAAVALRRH